jgi:hypothetical protein
LAAARLPDLPMTVRFWSAEDMRPEYHAGMAFKALRRSKGEAVQSYATTSNVVPGPFAEWPRREPDATVLHEQQYNQQRERLNAMLAAQGQMEEMFVAKVFAVSRTGGGSHTYTTWTEGVHTLLPAADVILLVEQPADAASQPPMTWARWDVVASLCAGDCWAVMADFQPPRVRTQRWPRPDQLAELKARALS